MNIKPWQIKAVYLFLGFLLFFDVLFQISVMMDIGYIFDLSIFLKSFFNFYLSGVIVFLSIVMPIIFVWWIISGKTNQNKIEKIVKSGTRQIDSKEKYNIFSIVFLVLSLIGLLPTFSFIIFFPTIIINLILTIYFKITNQKKNLIVSFIALIISIVDIIILMSGLSKGF